MTDKRMVVTMAVVLFVFGWGACATFAAGEKKGTCPKSKTRLCQCSAKLENDVLTLENNLIKRQYRWNGGNLISQSITDKSSGHVWQLNGIFPDCIFPDVTTKARSGQFKVTECRATVYAPAVLKAIVTYKLGRMEIKRVFRIYPDCPAIACDFFLRGPAAETWADVACDSTDSIKEILRVPDTSTRIKYTVIERLNLPGRHWRLTPVQFLDSSDSVNTLVQQKPILAYRRNNPLIGNILFADNQLNGKGIFILKQAPCSFVQLQYPGFDFVCKWENFRAANIGIAPAELNEKDWIPGYGFVTGVTSGGELGKLTALRIYQDNIRIRKAGRDEMIMMNTWGDRGGIGLLDERFSLAELDVGKRLGITHFQLDGGWQKGSRRWRDAGGALKRMKKSDPDYWKPRLDKFPNGLGPVVEKANELGIELCLRFAPNVKESYAHWKTDAEAMIWLYKEYGIRTFKIDNVDIADKKAEMNLRRIFEMIMDATNNEAVLNLDVTGEGRRFGYHYFTEYGNIFFENRYTDWKNYYPHWALRNLWMLSRYIPPQILQTEFLNKWRNLDNYADNDIFAPSKVPFDYIFATTMISQPLAWFEGTRLPEEALKIAPLIKQYREIMTDIHAGRIFPVGSEPNGRSWTGFQSITDDGGYFLIFREYNDSKKELVPTWFSPGQKARFKAVLGYGADFIAKADRDRRIPFTLPKPYSYALYKYTTRQ